jgi:hypothetical protein
MAALAEILRFPGFTERECSPDNGLYLPFGDKLRERTQEFAVDLG